MARYADELRIGTPRDPLTDLIVHLDYLAAEEFTVDLLRSRHGASAKEAAIRARAIIPHVRIASAYLDQTLSSQTDVSFLSAYYAILNLAKVYIFFSASHLLVSKNRWHGASYPGFEKDSRSLITEVIQLHPGGALPLLYHVITGRRISVRTRLRLGDVYPYLVDVGMEWFLATGERSRVARINHTIQTVASGRRVLVQVLPLSGDPPSLRHIPLVAVKSVPGGQFEYVSAIERDPTVSDRQLFERHIDHSLLYLTEQPVIPITRSKLRLPEELLIAIAFFHLSSVVRYKPEFLAELKESRYWPVVSAARWHCLYKFMVLFSSHIQQKTVRVNTSVC